MRNLTVSDIYCLSSQTEDTSSKERLFSVKGNVPSRLLRHRDFQYSDVFPPGCMGNNKIVDLDAINRNAKRRERLSYDEQERAMNILSKVHRNRKAIRLQRESNQSQVNNNTRNSDNINSSQSSHKYRLSVRKSQPDLSDYEYILEVIQNLDGKQIENDEEILSLNELKFMRAIITKEDAMAFFTSKLRGGSLPSTMCRNPITGNGLEENLRLERKRNFNSVIRFIENHPNENN